jgi:uncharacterized membrane protein (UPF0127 family)
MQMINLDTGKIIAAKTYTAYRFFQRLRGLMFTSELGSGCALHIKPCRSIHTFFMRYPIDVLYVNEHCIVIGKDENMPPGQIGKHYPDAESVIELPAGTIKSTGTCVGHRIRFQHE